MENTQNLSRVDRKPLSRKVKKRAVTVTVAAVAFFIGFVTAVPFIWMLICSFFGSADELFLFPPQFPDRLHFENYAAAINYMNLWNLLKNTMILVVCNMTLTIASSISVAYGFARFRGYGRNICFALLMSTMMLPWVVTMVPAYILFSRLHMIGTFLPLILPSIGGSAFYIFMMRQYFMGIPYDLDEAAKLDGCTAFGILVRVHLPNCWPILATMLIFSFNGTWGDYVGPSIYLLKEEMFTLSLGLQRFKTSNYTAPPWHRLMAGCVMFSLPMIVIFACAQKAFVRGIVTSGLK